MTALVDVTRDGPVTVLRLALEDKRNALTLELREALIAAVEDAHRAPDCRAIVLTGTGRSFCAGGDLDALPDHDPLAVRTRMQRGQHLVRLIAAGPKPVVAAVNGAAFGAGLSIAAAADWVVAGEAARFGAAFIRLGLMADLGLLWSLPHRMGVPQARRMLYRGLAVEAAEAVTLGLADEQAPDAQLLPVALDRAREFAEAAPVALAMMKGGLARSTVSLEEAFAIELEGQTLLFGTEDFVEGRTAFREKRAPRFRGR